MNNISDVSALADLVRLRTNGLESPLIACQNLNGKPNDIVDFVTTALKLETKTIELAVIDGHGNIRFSSPLPIDIGSLLPPPQLVSIPDPNLAAAIRQEIGDSITTHTLLNLTQLSVPNSRITDLTGLEHAHSLTYLNLGGEFIQGQGNFVNNNTVSNFSPLAELTNLMLHLPNSSLSDVAPLADLKNLTELHLTGNNISDVAPLANLKNLHWLDLTFNNISDVAPLASLKNLTLLTLTGNNISDVAPLVNLKKLHVLKLNINNISDVAPLLAFGPETESSRMQLNLLSNPLSDASINTHIPALLAKGMNVRYSRIASAQDIVDPPEKITGPWLWMIAPTDRNQGGAPSIDVDSLVAVSRGAVTESDVAVNGANEGDRVGGFVWILGQISPTEGDINECLNRIGMTTGDVNDHSAYALFSLPSDADRTGVRMSVGSDDAIKVWLNGEVVHKNAVDRPASDFQDTFQVDLKKGDNRLLVKVSERAGAWRMFVGIERFSGTQKPDIIADVNGDGVVNIQDLVSVASRLGHAGQHAADVNGDGVVNIQDLVLVAGELGAAAAAPSAWHAASVELPPYARVE